MRSIRRRPVLITAAAAAVVAVLVATTVFGGRLPWSSSGAPLVETSMLAPTVIDVPTEDSSLSIVPGQGGRVGRDGVSLVVPPGAAVSNSTVTVKVLQRPFHMTLWQSHQDGGTNPMVVGPVVDFGPEGTTFSEPVTVSVPYNQMSLPAGVSEDSIVPAYWNGQSWVVVSGALDKSADTVSVKLNDFKGVALVALAPAIPYVVLGTVIVGTVGYVGYEGYKWLKGDPISQGTAKEWITPDTDTVKKAASQAVITDAITNVQMSLNDPKMPAWLAAGNAQGHTMNLGYISNLGQVQAINHDEADGSGWQKPDNFFLTGDDQGPLHGDCTDSANSSVSVFIASGFRAKGVFGYNADGSGAAHEYAEVAIGGQLYRMDEGGIYSEENWKRLRFPTYNPPPSGDRRFDSMWDNLGQQPYNKDWWKELKLTLDQPTTSGMTAKFKVTADGIPISVQDLILNWDYGDGARDSSDSLKAPYTQPLSSEIAHTYTKPGDYTVKVTLWDETAFDTIPGASADKLIDATVTVKIAGAAVGPNYTGMTVTGAGYIEQISHDPGNLNFFIRMTGQRTFELAPSDKIAASLTGEISADGKSVTVTITYPDSADHPALASCANVTKLLNVPLVGPSGSGLLFSAKGWDAIEASVQSSMPVVAADGTAKCEVTGSEELKQLQQAESNLDVAPQVDVLLTATS